MADAPLDPPSPSDGPDTQVLVDADTQQLDVPTIHPEDPDDTWPATPTRSGVRLRATTLGLVALLVLAAGFWGGAFAEAHHHPASSSSSFASALAQRFSAASGSGASPSGGTGSSGSGAGGSGGSFGRGLGRFGLGGTGSASTAGGASTTQGIVTEIQGQTLYLTDSTGALVKVAVSRSATITEATRTSLSGLHLGDTVVVRGTASKGTIDARTVIATPGG